MYDDQVEDVEVKIVSRKKWGALSPIFTEPLPLPAERMMFMCTNTERCTSKAECIKAMRTIQIYYMEEKGMPDLPYSFLIGGDLRIYEGRGWGVMIRRRDVEDWVDERVVFGFIGRNNDNDKRMNKMVQKGYDLMYHAINNQYLVNFDEYGCQDEDAARYERNDLKERLHKKAQEEYEEDLKKQKKTAEKKKKDIKQWERNINELHFADAKKPKFLGDEEDLEMVKKENKDAFKRVKVNKKKLLKEKSDIDSDLSELLMSDGEDEQEPI